MFLYNHMYKSPQATIFAAAAVVLTLKLLMLKYCKVSCKHICSTHCSLVIAISVLFYASLLKGDMKNSCGREILS